MFTFVVTGLHLFGFFQDQSKGKQESWTEVHHKDLSQDYIFDHKAKTVYYQHLFCQVLLKYYKQICLKKELILKIYVFLPRPFLLLCCMCCPFCVSNIFSSVVLRYLLRIYLCGAPKWKFEAETKK